MKEGLNRTALHSLHVKAGARMTDFAGWDMPLHYGSQIAEHMAVRQEAGVFDVSHMAVIDIYGRQATAFLRYLLANDVAKLEQPGKALYTAMLNESAGVIDDLIVYRLSKGYRLVVNCATRRKDIDWMNAVARTFDIALTERGDLSILAIHGPASADKVSMLFDDEKSELISNLSSFECFESDRCLVARTGYTGEKGFEFILPHDDACEIWGNLMRRGIVAVGLAARDTLRLEAGMNLYGKDMDESVSPLLANMVRTIAWEPLDRQFVGRAALESQLPEVRAGKMAKMVGLVYEGRGLMRDGMCVVTNVGEGYVTSGGYSPTLDCSIALARVPAGSGECKVEIRGVLRPVQMVRPNFVRFGRKVYE